MKRRVVELKKLNLGKKTISDLASAGVMGGATLMVGECSKTCGGEGYSQQASCVFCGPTGAGDLTCSPSCQVVLSKNAGPGCAGSVTCPGTNG